MTRTIRTLGQAAQHDLLLKIVCPACRRETRFLASDVAALYGHGRSIDSLRFFCTACGARTADVLAYHHESSRTREVIVWRPMKIKAS
jgi:C4-type Zn-finger protein